MHIVGARRDESVELRQPIHAAYGIPTRVGRNLNQDDVGINRIADLAAHWSWKLYWVFAMPKFELGDPPGRTRSRPSEAACVRLLLEPHSPLSAVIWFTVDDAQGHPFPQVRQNPYQ